MLQMSKNNMSWKEKLYTPAPEVFFLVVIVAFMFLAGCTSAPTDKETKSLLETLEWGEGECGQFQLSGDVEAGTNPIPIFRSKLHLNLDKRKPCEAEQ